MIHLSTATTETTPECYEQPITNGSIRSVNVPDQEIDDPFQLIEIPGNEEFIDLYDQYTTIVIRFYNAMKSERLTLIPPDISNGSTNVGVFNIYLDHDREYLNLVSASNYHDTFRTVSCDCLGVVYISYLDRTI